MMKIIFSVLLVTMVTILLGCSATYSSLEDTRGTKKTAEIEAYKQDKEWPNNVRKENLEREREQKLLSK